MSRAKSRATPGSIRPGENLWDAKNVVVWIHRDIKQIFLAPKGVRAPIGGGGPSARG
jgi:hypothetical protein